MEGAHAWKMLLVLQFLDLDVAALRVEHAVDALTVDCVSEKAYQ